MDKSAIAAVAQQGFYVLLMAVVAADDKQVLKTRNGAGDKAITLFNRVKSLAEITCVMGPSD